MAEWEKDLGVLWGAVVPHVCADEYLLTGQGPHTHKHYFNFNESVLMYVIFIIIVGFLYVFRDALIKMKDVYEKNPQMGDPGSLQPKLTETMSNMDRLRMEIHKNEVRL